MKYFILTALLFNGAFTHAQNSIEKKYFMASVVGATAGALLFWTSDQLWIEKETMKLHKQLTKDLITPALIESLSELDTKLMNDEELLTALEERRKIKFEIHKHKVIRLQTENIPTGRVVQTRTKITSETALTNPEHEALKRLLAEKEAFIKNHYLDFVTKNRSQIEKALSHSPSLQDFYEATLSRKVEQMSRQHYYAKNMRMGSYAAFGFSIICYLRSLKPYAQNQALHKF